MSAKPKYAAATAVPVEKSEGEIKATLRRYGATAIATMESASDNTPFAEVCLSECQREYWTDQARSALQALKDSQ